MAEYSCNVVKDLMPLYVDGVVSEDSKKIVEAHVARCENCKQELEMMKQDIVLPVNKEVRIEKSKSLFQLRKMVRKWKRFAAIAWIVGIVGSLYCLSLFLCAKEVAIKYNGHNITVIEEDNGSLYLKYNGKGDILWNSSTIIETGECEIAFRQTLWDRYIQPIYKQDIECRYLDEVTEMVRITDEDGNLIWECSPEQKAAYLEKVAVVGEY